MIEVCNKVQEVNMSFIMSTPSRFTDALKKEEVTWPVFEHDLFLFGNDLIYEEVTCSRSK